MAGGGPRILVVGSLNMDLVVKVDQAPGPGQNVAGRDFATIPGGKSSNQAVACARLGAATAMIGAVGEDAFGPALREGLAANGVDVDAVAVRKNVSSGTAVIVVEPAGDARLIITPGANGTLAPADIEAHADRFAGADVVLTGFEIPMETVAAVVRQAKRTGTAVVLDAGPPKRDFCAEVFDADVLSPNEAEAAALLGMDAVAEASGVTGFPVTAQEKGSDAEKVSDTQTELGTSLRRRTVGVSDTFSASDPAVPGNPVTPEALARALGERAAGAVVLKCGAAGALIVEGGRLVAKGGHKVAVVDTTAAGDAFTAALAVAMAEGASLAVATEWANCAGALACTVFGAQPSMPTRGAVNGFAASVGAPQL